MTFSRIAGIGLLAIAFASPASAGTLEGPLEIIVSRDLQSLKVYDGDVVVASSKVSSGKPGHTTPTGIFSILEKKRMHHSNLYDDAEMPFMQRLTWSGIALHASNHVPSYPASHGCVRLPSDFARTLYQLTRRGGHVLISGGEVAPRRVVHRVLFRPGVTEPDEPLLSDAKLRLTSHGDMTGSIEVAMNEPKPETPSPVVMRTDSDPLRILITRRGDREKLMDLQETLSGLGYDVGIPDGFAGPLTYTALRAFQAAEGLKTDGMLTQDLAKAIYAKAGKGSPPNGQIMVRKNFTPLFEGPVEILNPEIALGAQFLLARGVDTDQGLVDWYGVSLANELPASTMKRLGITTIEDSFDAEAISRTLDRLVIPQDTRARIAQMMTEGTSISISDMGLGPETGAGTDFITVTRESAGSGSRVSNRHKVESSVVTIK
ncbi:L,D-transpeptidase family protein [Sinorhizobium sp. BG8]|uniref:L,D-transpeptidase family protein n=1 Tax=Sinorhizobium sp. BG8 TaxID=2613773 RepID=UPI00193CA7B1|nr:L,D-transpeptidase family protein [Sinorhizobium sp. BG8]QRM55029.1 L,D-transpeptidase family protein [Sinorhizobium sp. BG8]